MYKEASKLKLRIQTSKGLLSIEEVWDLSLAELDALAVSLEGEHKASGKKSFLVAKSKKDKVAKLKFDIVLDILTSKVEDAANVVDASAKKAHNEKIYGLIADKENIALAGKSVKELEKLIQK